MSHDMMRILHLVPSDTLEAVMEKTDCSYYNHGNVQIK